MNPFKFIGNMVRTIMTPSQWVKGFSFFGSGMNATVFDSVWAISGIEDKAQTLSSLPILFVGSDGKEIEVMSQEQKMWAYVLRNPDGMILGRQLWELTTMLYEIDGLAYWVLFSEFNQPIQNPLDIPTRIICFGQKSISPVFDSNDPTRMLGYMLTDGGVSQMLKPYQVVRFWKVNPVSYRDGLSMNDKVGLTIKLDKAARRTNANFFVNGARPSGFLKQVQATSESEAEKFAKDFRDRFASPDNAGKIPLIPKQFDFTPTDGVKDMDFVNLHKSNRDEIIAANRSPKHHLGINDDLNYATAEITDRVFYLNVIQPMATTFQDIVNGRLLLGTGMRIYFSFENIPQIQIEKLRVDEQRIKNKRELMRVASYLWKLGYPQNWINAYLELDLPEIKAPWANVPHDPSELDSKEQPSTSENNNEKFLQNDVKMLNAIEVPVDFSSVKSFFLDRTILDSVAAEDLDAMDLFCKNVESESIGKVIPQFAKVMDSYFDRLETSQIKRIEAFLNGESYANKAEGEENQITPQNVESVLFSRQKWDAILMTDTEALYAKAYKNSIEVLKDEMGGFKTFIQTDVEAIEAARKLQINVVGINERLRKNIRTSIVSAIEAGGGRAEIIEAVGNQFKASHARVSAIARTETGIAMNGARYDAMKVEVEKKQWVSAKDSNVRETHRQYTKKGSVEMDFEYTNGLRHPQDPDCPEAGEIVNCRCVLVAGK